MSNYKAFVSLCFEHGIYIRKDIMKEIGVKVGDFIAITTSSGVRRFTYEQVENIDKIKIRNEAYMLLSLFDTLACNHYYFLAEFGFTEKVSWVPKQYNYIIDIDPAFKLLDKHGREYKVFKKLYSIVEDKFLDMTMSLRREGFDPSIILTTKGEEFGEIKSKIMKEIESSADCVENIIKDAFQDADLVIGSGTYFSLTLFPFEIAFSISGIDVGSFALPSYKQGITINPFLFYWLLSSIFRSNGSKLNPNYVPVKVECIEDLEDREIPIKRLKLRTYSPSKLCVESFYYSESNAVQWVRDHLSNVFKVKPYVIVGDFLTPFTVPSVVRDFELVEYEREFPYKGPFVNITPYGLFIYKRDVRDILIVLEAIKHGAILFTNDINLRKLALMLGIPSISYNSLLDDIREVIREMCKHRKVHISDIVKAVKEFGLNIREEEYDEEEIKMALNYLVFSGTIKIKDNYVNYINHLSVPKNLEDKSTKTNNMN